MTRYFGRVMTDVVLLTYVYFAAAWWRVKTGAPVETMDTLLVAIGPFVFFHVAALAVMEGYDFTKTRSESDVGFSAVLGIFMGAAMSIGASTIFIVYYRPDAQVVPRSVFLIAGLLSIVLLVGWRLWYMRQRRRRGELTSRVLIVGPYEQAKSIGRELSTYSRGGHVILGTVSLDDKAPSGGKCLGTLRDLPALIERHNADELLIVGETLAGRPDYMRAILEIGKEARVKIHILPGFYETMVAKVDLYEIGGLPLVVLKQEPVTMSYAFFKRAMDIGLSTAGLVAASPVLLLAAIAIKLDSRGPVFYRQTRLGLNGRPFEIIKLRSMRRNAEKKSGPALAKKHDPRVTRVGRFLRRNRIDEFPQLWNVLKGDMSLVGPRPERPHFFEVFEARLPLFPVRLRIRPGLTSLSHVWGRYDSAPADRLRYDLVYMSNVSFLLDLRILLETVKIVLTGRGAQ